MTTTISLCLLAGCASTTPEPGSIKAIQKAEMQYKRELACYDALAETRHHPRADIIVFTRDHKGRRIECRF